MQFKNKGPAGIVEPYCRHGHLGKMSYARIAP